MSIIEPVIRPPAEAESFLLQVTLGCSANNCSFCGAYMNKPFRVKSEHEILEDIEYNKRRYPDTRRVFLMDGDALVLSNKRLVPILQHLQLSFPKLNRVASYANAFNLTNRSDSELEELYQHKLRLIYLGLESGNQAILDFCRKKASVSEMVGAVQRAQKAGVKSSVMVLLGLGGRKYSAEHIRDTITALNKMQPRYLSFLSVVLIPGTELFRAAKKNKFEELGPLELLLEAREIIKGLELTQTVFRSDHASNYLSLEGRFPADKDRLLFIINQAIDGQLKLKPDFLRGL